jgi:hypothetical protein
VSGPHADEGGEILAGMYAQSCISIEDSHIGERSRRAGGLDTGSGNFEETHTPVSSWFAGRERSRVVL